MNRSLSQPLNRVLFLDFDGVLNRHHFTKERWPEGSKMYGVEPALVSELVRILEETGCMIVVSSCWRVIHTIGELKRILHYQGGMPRPLLRRVRDVTGGGHRGHRGSQIDEWLSSHGSPPYAIVDDSDDFHEHQRRFIVRTRGTEGLTPSHADSLIAILLREDLDA